MPSRTRPAFAALWALDLAFADVVASSTDPRLGMIRLAWWRDRLSELYVDIPVPEEPRMQAADEHLHEFTNGDVLATIAESWMPLLQPFPWDEDVANGLRRRGEELFWVGSRILGHDQPDAYAAGALWSLVDAAHHCTDGQSRTFLLDEAGKALAGLSGRAPRRVRPLTVLSALAGADLLGRNRGMAALTHRLTGAFPRHS